MLKTDSKQSNRYSEINIEILEIEYLPCLTAIAQSEIQTQKSALLGRLYILT